MLLLQRFAKQGIVAQVNHSSREVVAGAPVCVRLAKLFRGEGVGVFRLTDINADHLQVLQYGCHCWLLLGIFAAVFAGDARNLSGARIGMVSVATEARMSLRLCSAGMRTIGQRSYTASWLRAIPWDQSPMAGARHP